MLSSFHNNRLLPVHEIFIFTKVDMTFLQDFTQFHENVTTLTQLTNNF